MSTSEDITVDLQRVPQIGSTIAAMDGYSPKQWDYLRQNSPNFIRSRPAYKAALAVLAALREEEANDAGGS